MHEHPQTPGQAEAERDPAVEADSTRERVGAPPGLTARRSHRALGNRAIIQARIAGASLGLLREDASGGHRGSADDIRAAAGEGVAGAGAPLPHLERLRSAFPGSPLLDEARAYTGNAAAVAARRLGAAAFATHDGGVPKVAFRDPAPDLATTVHEVAHLHQQRRGEVPAGSISREGDALEREADAAAERAAAGLGAPATGGAAEGPPTEGAIQPIIVYGESTLINSGKDPLLNTIAARIEGAVQDQLGAPLREEGTRGLRRWLRAMAREEESHTVEELTRTFVERVRLLWRDRAKAASHDSRSATDAFTASDPSPTDLRTLALEAPWTPMDLSGLEADDASAGRVEAAPAGGADAAAAPAAAAPARVPDPTDPTARRDAMAGHLGTLFATARIAKYEFKDTVRRWASKDGTTTRPVKGRTVVFRGDGPGHTRDEKLYSGMKKIGRSVTKAIEKVSMEGKTIESASRAQTDVLGATIRYDTLSGMRRHLPKLKKRIRADGELVILKNRITDPNNRDMLLNIRLRSGLTIEVQLALSNILARKQETKGIVPSEMRETVGMGAATTHQVYDVKRELQSLVVDLPEVTFPVDEATRDESDHMLRRKLSYALSAASSLGETAKKASGASPRTPRGGHVRRASSRSIVGLESLGSLRRTYSALPDAPTASAITSSRDVFADLKLKAKLGREISAAEGASIEARKRDLKARYSAILEQLVADFSLPFRGAPGAKSDALALKLTDAPFKAMFSSEVDSKAEAAYEWLQRVRTVGLPKAHDLTAMDTEMRASGKATIAARKGKRDGPPVPAPGYKRLKEIYTAEASAAIDSQGGVTLPRRPDAAPASQRELITKYRKRIEGAYHRTEHERLHYMSHVQTLIDVLKGIEDLYEQMDRAG